MILNPVSGVPFYRQVQAHLAEEIRAGHRAPGTLLPSVRALAQELVVSVITVKQAYDALEADGLVYSHQGRGTFVAADGAAAARRQVEEKLRSALFAAIVDARAGGMASDALRAIVLEQLERA